MVAGGAFLLRRRIRPVAAKWYGKVTTVIFYLAVLSIVIHAAFLPQVAAMRWVSGGLVVLTCLFMVFTFIQYLRIFLRILREEKQKKQKSAASPEDLTA